MNSRVFRQWTIVIVNGEFSGPREQPLRQNFSIGNAEQVIDVREVEVRRQCARRVCLSGLVRSGPAP